MEGMEQDGSAAAAVRAAGGSASGGARAEAEPDNEVLALVCPPVSPAAAFNKMVGDNEAASEHMNDLSMRRESLKFVLARTLTNLAYFTEQCKSNPSCEVRRRLPPPHPPAIALLAAAVRQTPTAVRSRAPAMAGRGLCCMSANSARCLHLPPLKDWGSQMFLGMWTE